MPDLGWSEYIDGVWQAEEGKFLAELATWLEHLADEQPTLADDARALREQVLGLLADEDDEQLDVESDVGLLEGCIEQLEDHLDARLDEEREALRRLAAAADGSE
jgi:hypothetical protein